MKKPLFLLSLILCLCTCLLAACDTAQPTDTTAPDGEAEPTAEETTVPATEAPTEPVTEAPAEETTETPTDAEPQPVELVIDAENNGRILVP
jgi:hypothetical protein